MEGGVGWLVWLLVNSLQIALFVIYQDAGCFSCRIWCDPASFLLQR